MGALIDLNGLGHYKSKENAMVASVYSATKTYAVGDYAYYNGTLYRCTTAITTAEAWTSGHWTAAKIGDDVTELKTALSHVENVENSTGNQRLSSWTIGRAEAGSNNPISWCCYSNIIPTDGTYYYFDDTKYKVVLSWFATNSQATATSMGSWVNESPVRIYGNSNPYCKINVALKSGSGNIDTSDVNATTYCIVDTTSKIVTIANAINSVFVSAQNGNDSNDGTATAPFKTIQKAIDSGCGHIYVEPDEYAPFSIENKSYPIDISLYNRAPYTPNQRNQIKIVATNTYHGITINNCHEVTLNDIYVYNPQRYGFYVRETDKIVMNTCVASDNQTTGFSLFYFERCYSECNNCTAFNSTLDGFNYHGEGASILSNCIAYDNGDDGASHHEGFVGAIYGGEFYGNGKAGVAPYSGAKINVYDAYIHNNTQYGLICGGSSSDPRTKVIVSNCAIKNNTTNDIKIDYADVVGFNNLYGTKSVGDNGTFTEIT